MIRIVLHAYDISRGGVVQFATVSKYLPTSRYLYLHMWAGTYVLGRGTSTCMQLMKGILS